MGVLCLKYLKIIKHKIKKNSVTIYTDGSCQPNPGYGTWGFICFDDTDTEIAQGRGKGSNKETSNTMEYQAVIEALKWVKASGVNINRVTILSDSVLVVNTITNRWKTHMPHIRSLCQEAQALIGNARIKWISRVYNRADAVAENARYDAGDFLGTPEYIDDLEQQFLFATAGL